MICLGVEKEEDDKDDQDDQDDQEEEEEDISWISFKQLDIDTDKPATGVELWC